MHPRQLAQACLWKAHALWLRAGEVGTAMSVVFWCILKLSIPCTSALAPYNHAWWTRRGVITMEQPCMRSYSLLLIKTCHRRGVHAMGGMAAQIPIKNDPQANEAALVKVTPLMLPLRCHGTLQQVRTDEQRELRDGCDSTRAAHAALAVVA